MKRKCTILIFCLLFVLPACKQSTSTIASLTSDDEAKMLADADSEFSDLQLDFEIGYLGSFKRSNPVDAFFNQTEIEALETEMTSATKNDNYLLKFLYCDHRGFFPRTEAAKECDYVVGGEQTTLEFSFIALDKLNYKPCYLSELNCAIFQKVSVFAKNNGIQRPPVFVLKEPVKERMLLYTNRVFYGNTPGIGGFLQRWTEADQFAALVITPYSFSRPFGEELAKLMGDCSNQYMNVIHFAKEAIKRYQERKKPVLLSAVAANSVLLAGMTMIGGSSILKIKGGVSAIKASGFGAFKAKTKAQISLGALSFADDLAAIPYVLADLGNWRDNIKKYPVGSPQHRAIQTALFLANFGDVAGLTHLGIIAKKHWKTAAKVLTTITVGTGAAVGISKTPLGDELVTSMRHGEIEGVRSALCEIQKAEGSRQFCPPPPKSDYELCKS